MWTRAPDVVGRADELRRLDEALAAARAGNGEAVFLVGEAGIGKTRLAASAIASAVEEGMTVLRGRGSALGPMVPFRPLTEALMAFARGAPDFDLDVLGPYRGVLGRLVPDWRAAEPGTLDADSSVVLAEALLRLTALAGAGRGCLLVLDDLQFADAETLAVVEYLLDNLADVPVVLVVTIRVESAAQVDLALAAERRGVGEVLRLAPLTTDEIRRLIASCMNVAPEDVPPETAEKVAADSAGNPFFAEEMVRASGEQGLLRADAAALSVVPETVVRALNRRTDLLGDESRAVLTVAAAIGQRFCLPVVQLATGEDERTVLAVVHGGVAAELVEPDEPTPDWYAFRHPLTVESLLAALTPTEHAALADRVADAVERHDPDLTGEWCATVASLRERSGDPLRAGRLFATAGRRALADGAARSAVTLLRRAHTLFGGSGADTTEHAEVIESLLFTLAESGRHAEAEELGPEIERLRLAGLPTGRCAAMYAQLANAAQMAGQWPVAAQHVETARSLLGADPAPAAAAPVDVVAAHLALREPGPERLVVAERLARSAASAAERADLPLVLCDAWQLLGVLARDRDLDEATDWFRRARDHAETRRMPIQRVVSEVMEAGVTCLVHGDVGDLVRARRHALDIGLLPMAYEVDGILAMQQVLRGEYEAAGRAIDECLSVATRLRLGRIVPYLLASRAVLAAHRGARDDMERVLGDLTELGGQAGYEQPMSYGLARTFCALLEGDLDAAEREQASAVALDLENPSTNYLSGRYGLSVLMAVRAGRAGWSHLEALAGSSAVEMRWNAQFIGLARAVLHGRDGDRAAAVREAGAAVEAAAIYPTAGHVGRWMVAGTAHADGWGEPEAWLWAAEAYFHDGGVPVMAGACRSALRSIGAPVRQRRDGLERVPESLRLLGVTSREWDVGELLGQGLGNKAVARRLHISPRTVEKHVASLMMKTAAEHRDALADVVREAQP
jgi:DNA-binding CsgD family transcriptional regulator